MPVPDKLWLSAEKLEPEGVYLLEVSEREGDAAVAHGVVWCCRHIIT